MIHSSLTHAQRAQVAYLFADDAFGTDASAYEYETEGDKVTGRSRIAKDGEHRGKRKPHHVAVRVEVREVHSPFVTGQMQRDAQVTYQVIARSVVERIINQEVSHEK